LIQRDSDLCNQRVIEQLNAACRECAHRDFRLLRQSNFSHYENVEGESQRLRYLSTNRYTAARKGENDGIGSAVVVFEMSDESLASINAIAKAVNRRHARNFQRRKRRI
jgi:hypothetical protein